MSYTPQPGTLPARALPFLAQLGVGQWVPTGVLAAKLDVETNMIGSGLESAVRHGIVLCRKREGLREWSIGPGTPPAAATLPDDEPADPADSAPLNPVPPKPDLRQRSVFPAAAKAKRAPRQLLDLDAVKIRKGVPIPPANIPGQSRYAELWQRMAPGDCVELPERQANGLCSVAKSLKQPYAMRRTGDGVRTVWKVTPTTATGA